MKLSMAANTPVPLGGTVYLKLTTWGAYLAINIFISIIIWNLAFTKQRYSIVTFTDQTFFA